MGYLRALNGSGAAWFAANPGLTFFVSHRVYGETASANFMRSLWGRSNSISSADTPEKTNSRSPAYDGTMTGSPSSGDITNNVVIMAGGNFSMTSWIAHPRYPYTWSDGDKAQGSPSVFTTSNPSTTICVNQERNVAFRRFSRRSTKPGYWPQYGNHICHQEKTGGGAYVVNAPHFESDLTWLDRSPWQLGQVLAGDVNLFPPPAATAVPSMFLLLGVGA